MSAAGVRGKGKGLRAALVPASTRKVNDGWTNNAFDAASLVVGNPRLMRVCARQVVTHVDAALTAGVDPLVRGVWHRVCGGLWGVSLTQSWFGGVSRTSLCVMR